MPEITNCSCKYPNYWIKFYHNLLLEALYEIMKSAVVIHLSELN